MSARLIPVDPFDLVVFGGTGDLAMRKLLPGLYHRDCDDQIAPESRIMADSRQEIGRRAYIDQVEAAVRRHTPEAQIRPEIFERFLRRLDHVPLDATRSAGWKKLAGLLQRNGKSNGVRVFYLATTPSLFGPVAQNLAAHDLVTADSRVVVEKPIGRNLASARAINEAVGAVFEEHQIFRIDHYLGKETVQNPNLGRAVIKVSAVKPERRVVEAPARVFHDQNDMLAAFKAGELDQDLVAVVRFQGPTANGMPELHKLTPALGILQDKGFKVALLTDGRMSGASGKVPAAIHLTPEATHGGPIAKIRDGDLIRIDAEEGRVEALVDAAEWAAREPATADLAASHQGCGRELFTAFRRNVGTADTGASVIDFAA